MEDRRIIIQGAAEANLKNLTVEIPRNQLVVLTGLSGAGKSTLAIEVLYQECQRQYLEAIGYQGIQKPKVEAVLNLSPAVRITQTAYARNPRSTVGTLTNLYTDLRMLFEKLSVRPCPACGESIKASDSREQTEKTEEGFQVYMFCPVCGHRMEKLTRSHFSFNTREGACEVCQGLGEIPEIHLQSVLDEARSLKAGAVLFWDHNYKDYQIQMLENAFIHFGLESPGEKPVGDFSPGQKAILLYGAQSEQVKSMFPQTPAPKKVNEGNFEGILTTLWRRLSEKGSMTDSLAPYFQTAVCSACQGEKLATLSRTATVIETRLPELCAKPLQALGVWLADLEVQLSPGEKSLVAPYLLDLSSKLRRLFKVGLDYLSMERQTMTLSGGEAQRIKLAAVLDSSMTGLIYILDEPTVGLHPRDTEGLLFLLKTLRDLDNTVLVIEHDPDVIRAADYILDMGPGSGRHGGEIVGAGTYAALLSQPGSVTGHALSQPLSPLTTIRRLAQGYVSVRNANRHNLKNIDVQFPLGCLTSVTGVSGSGKSTLVFEVLGAHALNPTVKNPQPIENLVTGTEVFSGVILVEQMAPVKMRRSNVATYSGIYGEIRKVFGALEAARDKGLDARHFSFNSKGGRCEYCEGLGYVESNLLFFESLEVVCPQCGGSQFNETVLSVAYQGHTIKDVLKMTLDEAAEVFAQHPGIMKTLRLLLEVGLGYLTLGQTLTTLSGGEAQRLKLSKALTTMEKKRTLYLIDEPTTGLHPVDVTHFLTLLNKIVDAGNTVILVEHNLQVIGASDWVIDLGPLGGVQGGQIIAQGTPAEIARHSASMTGRYLLNDWTVC